jgi:hypothetical protein
MGDWAEMEAWSSESLEQDKYGQIIRTWRLHSLYQQARARRHAGNLEGLRDTFQEAMRPDPQHDSRHVACCRAHARAGGTGFSGGTSCFKVTQAISSAQVMLAYTLLLRGQSAESMTVFQPFLEQAEVFNLTSYLLRENPHVVPLLRQAHSGTCTGPM